MMDKKQIATYFTSHQCVIIEWRRRKDGGEMIVHVCQFRVLEGRLGLNPVILPLSTRIRAKLAFQKALAFPISIFILQTPTTVDNWWVHCGCSRLSNRRHNAR